LKLTVNVNFRIVVTKKSFHNLPLLTTIMCSIRLSSHKLENGLFQNCQLQPLNTNTQI